MRPVQEQTKEEPTRRVGLLIPVSLHEQAQRKTRARFQNFSSEVRRLLVEYVKDDE